MTAIHNPTKHERAQLLAADAYRAVFSSEPTACELATLCAISWLETRYGEAWAGGPGEGSFNMGSVTADRSWTGETFSHEDSRWDDKTQSVVKYVTNFRKYPSEQAGWLDFVKAAFKWLGRDVKVKGPATTCNFLGVAQGLYDTRYYLGVASTPAENVATYLGRLVAALKAGGLLPVGVDVSPPISTTPPKPGTVTQGKASIAPLLIMGVAGALFYLTTRAPRGRKSTV
jgi:hypothetical protein